VLLHLHVRAANGTTCTKKRSALIARKSQLIIIVPKQFMRPKLPATRKTSRRRDQFHFHTTLPIFRLFYTFRFQALRSLILRVASFKLKFALERFWSCKFESEIVNQREFLNIQAVFIILHIWKYCVGTKYQ